MPWFLHTLLDKHQNSLVSANRRINSTIQSLWKVSVFGALCRAESPRLPGLGHLSTHSENAVGLSTYSEYAVKHLSTYSKYAVVHLYIYLHTVNMQWASLYIQ